MATTTRHNAQPISYYWNLVKDMGDSQKLELVTMLIDSVKPVVEKTEVAEDEEYSLRPFTVEELNVRIDQAEAQIAAGLVVSHEDMMREWEEELAHEEQEEHEIAKTI